MGLRHLCLDAPFVAVAPSAAASILAVFDFDSVLPSSPPQPLWTFCQSRCNE